MPIMIELGLTNLPKKRRGTSPHVPIHSGGPEKAVYAAFETRVHTFTEADRGRAHFLLDHLPVTSQHWRFSRHEKRPGSH